MKFKYYLKKLYKRLKNKKSLKKVSLPKPVKSLTPSNKKSLNSLSLSKPVKSFTPSNKKSLNSLSLPKPVKSFTPSNKKSLNSLSLPKPVKSFTPSNKKLFPRSNKKKQTNYAIRLLLKLLINLINKILINPKIITIKNIIKNLGLPDIDKKIKKLELLLNSKNWENNIFEIINNITNNIIKIYENSIIVYTLGLSKPFKESMKGYIIYVKKLNKKNNIDINWIKNARDNEKFNIIKKLLKIIKIYINENINKTTNKENIYELDNIIKKYKEFKENIPLSIRSNSMSL